MDQKRLTHLRQLEAESIHIIREVSAEFSNPVMLYSIGKDSSVMLHLARKAFYPGTLPFEEKSRAKERIYSFRDRFHRWDPKNQRPELWHNYNGQINKGESIRVFPLSNWTEQDIWQYIWLENIDIVPLYLAAERPVLERDGMLMMIDDNRINLQPGEVIKKRMVRFRTLGCWPLTGAVESNAQTLPEIIEEMLVSTTSERQGRVIDRDQAGSMELKKRQGYF